MLFPTSIVDMYMLGFLKNLSNSLELNVRCSRSISNLSLSDERNAISSPENSAENRSAAINMYNVWLIRL